MPITQASVLKALKNICHQIDKKQPKIKFVHKGKTRKMRSYYDLLRMDANMPGLTKFLLAEINDYKLRDRSNASNYVPKHQLVHILKSFMEPVGSSPEKEAYLKPVIEGMADFLIFTMKRR